MTSDHVVVAGHYLAAQAGRDILQAGGNAIDAGVAAGVCLGVLQSDIVNFAGVAPIIIRLAGSGDVVTISGLGYWPRQTRPEVFREDYGGAIPAGVLRSVLPAAPDAWISVLERYGTMTFGEVAGPAIDLAARGFPAHPLFCETIETHAADYARWPSNAAIYLPGGRPPTAGDIFVQTDLAATISFMAAEEAAAKGDRSAGLQAARRSFYEGDIAQRIASFYQSEGGWLGRRDLAEFHSGFEEPIAGHFRDLEIYTCGPWCQGPVLQQMFAILEHFPLERLPLDPVQYAHTLVEVVRRVFHDRERAYGDPRFIDVPLAQFMSRDYAAACANRISATGIQEFPWPETRGSAAACGAEVKAGPRDTSYVGVVDKAGNVFSATPSDVSYDVPVTPGTGFCVSSRGAQSWTEAGHPSSVEPGKRPRLTPSPAIVCRPSELYMPIGTPGGDVQSQAMLQVLLNVFVHKMGLQAAVEAPRVATFDHPDSFEPHARQPKVVMVEPGLIDAVGPGLAKLGHEIKQWPHRHWKAGGVCTIAYDPRTGVSTAGTDPRRPSGAAGR